jgi:hypothetical protein
MVFEKEKKKGMVFDKQAGNQPCLGRISSQGKARAKRHTAKSNARNRPYKQGYQKEELLCTESDAHQLSGFSRSGRVRSTQRSSETTASLNMERLS